MASASTVSEGKQSAQRRRSCDTVCSSNSSCFLHKRKPAHPLANSIRTYVSRNSNNTVKQRVLSARLLKLRSLQNQLNDANFHLAELQQENRALRNLQTRQDKALSRYEGTNADLPRLLKSHEEEIRVLDAKNRTLRKNLKDAAEQLKIKEDELASVREQLKNLVSLTKSKNLGERHTLAEQVEELKDKLKSSEDKINLLNRKLLLESKNYKYKLNGEISKNKQAQKELAHALAEIDKLSGQTETKGKFAPLNGRKRFAAVNQRQSVSLINLTNEKIVNKHLNKTCELTEEQKLTFNTDNHNNTEKDDNDYHSDHMDIKLEPISSEKDAAGLNVRSIMISPSDTVKARLSANLSAKCRDSDIEHLSKSIEKLNTLDNGNVDTTLSTSTLTSKSRSRPNSSQKPKKLPSVDLQLKFSNGGKIPSDIDKRLGSCCDEMLSTAKQCSAVITEHTQNYQAAKTETEKLLQNLRETDALNSKLRYSNFLTKEPFEIPEKDIELVTKIWKDEYDFRKERTHSKENLKDYDAFIKSDRNGNVIRKEMDVALEDKTKLLAALRAIDNGEEIEEIKYTPSNSHKNKVMEELFGDLHK